MLFVCKSLWVKWKTFWYVINVNNICFEYIHSDGVGSGMNTKKFLNTNKHLENFGYYLQKIDKDNHNVIYTKK